MLFSQWNLWWQAATLVRLTSTTSRVFKVSKCMFSLQRKWSGQNLTSPTGHAYKWLFIKFRMHMACWTVTDVGWTNHSKTNELCTDLAWSVKTVHVVRLVGRSQSCQSSKEIIQIIGGVNQLRWIQIYHLVERCLVDLYDCLLQEGQTPLHLACQKTDAEIVTILLSQDTSSLETKDEVLTLVGR